MAEATKTRTSTYYGPKDADLDFLRLGGHESLGRLYSYDVDLVSERGDIRPADLLGETASIELAGRERYKRYFHGCVTSADATGFEGRLYHYRVTLRPWLWLLDQTADCRIFQEQDAVAIIETIFRDLGCSDYELALNDKAGLPKRPYCVQYQESAFQFVSRLMEEEGIYYYFRHEKDKHVLVLADDPSSHSPDSRYGKLPYHAAETTRSLREDHIARLSSSACLTSGPFETGSYDFDVPRKDLGAAADIGFSPPLDDYKVFNWSGRYTETKAGDRLALVRAQSVHAKRETYTGQADAPAIAVGNLVTVEGHPDRRLNREFLITALEPALAGDDYQGGSSEEPEYRCAFAAIPSGVVYRSEPVTPRPRAEGLQTAMVVGKSGEEIWTDKHGRVKVQFHWDRYGAKDENSSCWVRVSQAHAGASWGGIHLPRIGEEVVISFEDADPDRPVVIGRLYNGQAKPPYALPGKRTQSGLKTSTSKGGGGYNELRFEDKKGSEEVYLRAEKDLNALVQNDRSFEVGHDQVLKVENDDTAEIGNDQKLDVGNNQTIKIGQKLEIDAGKEITLKSGMSKIVLKQNGNIEISGVKIVMKGKSAIELKSNLNLKAKGTIVDIEATGKMALKGALIQLSAKAMAKLKGAITMIG